MGGFFSTPTLPPAEKTRTPYISARISASSDKLDITPTAGTPLTLTIEHTLNHPHPITFLPPLGSGLFAKSGIFRDEGLTFTDTASGERVPRGRIHICTMGSEPEQPFSKKTQDRWVTLYPGTPHRVEATFETVFKHPLWLPNGTDTTPPAYGSQPKRFMWLHVGGLEDGKTYRVGVSEGAGIRGWHEGSKEDFLGWWRKMTDENRRHDAVEYRVEETVSFTVSRPDEDGSLTYLLS
ncbi:hypothetical protein CkaCkLH20_07889 [Colletotrichum karsti]|uniref:Uncharacterized protein n=1 Tax=Colletotrichum karsti TaxID=1095194 RepID=A0A9P6I0K7_9PEZI|nr:uncharacterized protein CkaCkLH20_07889 [Colletotrichum karsti]KAF9874752.1 hypothetical protein CkaCkLH20_07889 [Colletotrichum karsti]